MMTQQDVKHYRDMRVLIIAGGPSEEAAISLQGADMVQNAISEWVRHVETINPSDLKELPVRLQSHSCDAVFIMMHGFGGEDGQLQTILDDLELPYTGSNAEASQLAWDKLLTKARWREHGMKTPDAFAVDSQTDLEKAFAMFDEELIIKPRCGGSSMGLLYVRSSEAMREAQTLLKQYKDGLMAESLVKGPEYTVPVLHQNALPAIRIEAKDNMYDYHAKYCDKSTRYLCPSGLPDDAESELRQLALDAFKALGCTGWGRVDVMRDPQHDFQLLEINTVPGMTERSLVPVSANVMRMDFSALALSILDTAQSTLQK